MADDLDTVIAESVEDAGGGAPEDSAPAPEPTPAPAAAAPDPSGFSDDDLKAFGLEVQGSLQPGQRENRIPYSRVRTIVENARKKLHRDWDQERTQSTQLQQALEQRLQQMDALGQIMQTDPARFIQMLQNVNPEYARYQIAQAAAHAAAADGANGNGDGRPEPDLDLGNGYRTYSPQGLDRLLDWQAQQLESRIKQRYEPIEQTFQEQRLTAEASRRVTAQLNEAITWPAFEQHAPQILEALKRDRMESRARGEPATLTLEAAYRRVVLPKLALDRDQLRAQLLKEIQSAPTSTAAPAAGTVGAASAGGAARDLEDVIRESIRAPRPAK